MEKERKRGRRIEFANALYDFCVTIVEVIITRNSADKIKKGKSKELNDQMCSGKKFLAAYSPALHCVF